MSTYTAVHLAQRPKNEIVPGETFKLKTHQAPKESDLKDGEVMIQNARSYVPPVQIDEIMRGSAIGVVKASKSAKFPVGSYAIANIGWTELAIANEKTLENIEVPKNGKVTDALGVLGLTGLTAYFGILQVGQVKAGDFVVVSGAAGATGSVVGQIAKLKGATVLALAGTDDKCTWLVNELGFDAALNYKDKDFAQKFRAATKGFIDVYFDNVGGEILDMALARAKPHARFVMCGGVSQYNSKDIKGPKNYLMIVSMRIRMEGFIVFDYAKQYAEARKELARWLEEGKIKRKETIVKGGLKEAERALVGLYQGLNTGKLLVEVSREDVSSKI